MNRKLTISLKENKFNSIYRKISLDYTFCHKLTRYMVAIKPQLHSMRSGVTWREAYSVSVGALSRSRRGYPSTIDSHLQVPRTRRHGLHCEKECINGEALGEICFEMWITQLSLRNILLTN